MRRVSISIHPYLKSSSTPAFDYDLRDPPSFALHHHHRVSSRIFAEPASVPPLRGLNITYPSEYVPWPITVCALNGSYVTVGDVLEAIYRTLRLIITPAEYNMLNPQDRRRAFRAFEQRYRRQRSTLAYEQEKRGGMRRVDFLMGRTKFLGLSTTSRGLDMWQLSVR